MFVISPLDFWMRTVDSLIQFTPVGSFLCKTHERKEKKIRYQLESVCIGEKLICTRYVKIKQKKMKRGGYDDT